MKQFIILDYIKSAEIKYPRKFIRMFLKADGNRVVDLYQSTSFKDNWYAVVISENHIIYKYTFHFGDENPHYYLELG